MKEKSNKQFMILSAIGIIQVVMCHLAPDVKLTGYIFPYTSFFMTMFVFISGYFYSVKKEEHIFKTIWEKFKKIMLPFLIINLCYGMINTILRNAGVINYGRDISLYTLFIQPFIDNSQFIFNFPSWFIPAFFTTYIVYLLIHKLTSKIKLNEYILLLILLVGNMIAVYNQEIARLEDIRSLLLRILFFLPFFQMGYLYKTTWQKYEERVKTWICIPIVIIINIILISIFKDIEYDLHEFSGFIQNAYYLPILTFVTGTLFWLRISKILEKWIGNNKLVNYISNNTFSIMSHHLFYIFILNFVLYLINVPYFDLSNFQNGWIYRYQILGWEIPLQIGYLLLGVLGPIGMKYLYDKININLYKNKEKVYNDKN